MNYQKKQTQEKQTGGIFERLMDWTGIGGAIKSEQQRRLSLKRIQEAKEWVNMPYKEKMELLYDKGGKHGGNLSESEIQAPNALRWFVYNLDGNDEKQVRTLQRKLNTFFKESGYDLTPIPVEGQFGRRTILRMNHFIGEYDKHYNTTVETKEALRGAEELLFRRDDPFTTEKDTMDLKSRLEKLNTNEETMNILKDLEMIPK